MNVVDWLLLGIVVLAALRGCFGGLRAVLAEFVALLGGLFAAARLGPAVAAELDAVVPVPASAVGVLGYVATFAIVCAGLLLLGRTVLATRLHLPFPSMLGAVAGLLLGIVLAALLAATLFTAPLPGRVTLAAAQSRFGARLAAPALRLVAPLRQ